MRDISLPVAERRRRDASVRGVVRRGRLTAGTPPRTLDKAFLQRLKEIDKKLDLYWHPIKHKWILYRQLWRGAAPADDKLILVTALDDWPGNWLIHRLQKMDVMSRHPECQTPKRAAKLEMDRIDALDEARELAHKKKYADMSHGAAEELRKCIRARTSVVVDKEDKD